MKANDPKTSIDSYLKEVEEKAANGKVKVIISANSWQVRDVEKLTNKLLKKFGAQKIQVQYIYSS